MKFAIPVADGKLFGHFGQAPSFALIETDDGTGKILARNDLEAPPHEPGALPAWLAELGVDLVMTGGIGPRAVTLLAQSGIKVLPGVPDEAPEALIAAHYAGTLEVGANDCHHDHDDHHHSHHH